MTSKLHCQGAGVRMFRTPYQRLLDCLILPCGVPCSFLLDCTPHCGSKGLVWLPHHCCNCSFRRISKQFLNLVEVLFLRHSVCGTPCICSLEFLLWLSTPGE